MPNAYSDADVYKKLTLGLVRDHMGGLIDMARQQGMASLPLIRAAALADDLPLPPTDQRNQYYDNRHYEYWLSGRADMDAVLSGVSGLPEKPTIFELGCGSGRVLRHAESSLGRPCTMIGADIEEHHVGWVNYHLWPRMTAILCRYDPPLPLADNSVDLILAFSVFTHIHEFETAWLMEMQRILRPGGQFYATVHDEFTWRELDTVKPSTYGQHPVVQTARERSRELEARLQVIWGFRTHKLVDVFHPQSYIRSVWGRFFHIEEIATLRHYSQTGVLMRKA